MNTFTLASRDLIGNAHYMKQLERDYRFPVFVVKENDDGTRELIRVE